MVSKPNLYRRDFLLGSLAACASASCGARGCTSQSAVAADIPRPVLPCGAQTGDPTARGVVLWSQADRPAHILVEWGTDPSLRDARRVEGPLAHKRDNYTARVELTGLPPGRRIHYRVVFESDDVGRARSEPVLGSFRAPPGDGEDVTIVWSGDTAGQGYGIDLDRGGMKTYSTIARLEPDIFLNSGDRIYADNPLPPEIKLPDGSIWKNVVTPAKSKVAETLDEFRGNYAYDFLDENVRALAAKALTIVQWDDHEVRNNWYPGQILEDNRYGEKSASVLAARARQAMVEYSPMRPGPIHRVLSYGPNIDVFVLDCRTFRGPNGANREAQGSSLLGKEQISWLKDALAKSTATWKIIACDQPIGLVITDDGVTQEGFCDNDGATPRGRELELAEILSFLKSKNIKNVVWVTADVHYAAAHHFDPARAAFKDFDPFWEFIAGPLHAGTFGPNPLDSTFGPEVQFTNTGPGWTQNAAPSEQTTSFGVLHFNGKTKHLRVALCNGAGKELWSVDLEGR